MHEKMIINLISNLSENAQLEQCRAFNHVVAWFLREAFKKQGCEARFVRDHDNIIPLADHTIVFSNIAMKRIRSESAYYNTVRKATRRKMTLYLDCDILGFEKWYDIIFTVIEPLESSPKKFMYAGWGADPTHCYLEQKEPAAYLDSLMYGFYKGELGKKCDEIYRVMENVLSSSGLKVYVPIPRYNLSPRLPWLEIMKIMRRCHFYCCTQYGESGLMRIEAATCGALLVVPQSLYRYRTMGSLEHAIWASAQELRQILKSKTDPDVISRKARAHTWDKVAARILAEL